MCRCYKYYTVYERATEEVLAFGTAKECAEKLGISQASFYCLVTRSAQRPHGRYEVMIEEDEEDG